MNVLILGHKDDDSAGIVTNDINQYFLQQGHNSVLIVKESGLNNNNVIVLERPPVKGSLRFYKAFIKHKYKRIRNRIFPLRREVKHYFHNINENKVPYTASEILKKAPFEPDVILFFWVTGFVNSKMMKEFSEISKAGLYWVGSDNAPFTGGCHYPWDCKGFQSDCTDCPAILTKSKKYIAQKNLSIKKHYLPERIEFISGSASDYSRALSSSIFKGKIIHKLFGPVNEKKFKPGNKAAAKTYFKISAAKKVIFYGSYNLMDERKGSKYFSEAIRILATSLQENNSVLQLSDYVIIVAGNRASNSYSDKIEVVQTGYLTEDDLIKAYQAADLFVSSSVEDSGPLMVNQSLMCGTPAVCFNTGVAMDIVHSGITGYRASLFDAKDLANGIKFILSLNEEDYKKIVSNCRNLAINNFSAQVFINNLTHIFNGKTIVQNCI
jgi:glycosyltransferase involved in cell wall biosynthesis